MKAMKIASNKEEAFDLEKWNWKIRFFGKVIYLIMDFEACELLSELIFYIIY